MHHPLLLTTLFVSISAAIFGGAFYSVRITKAMNFIRSLSQLQGGLDGELPL